jgi:NAD(P)H-hydrate epimerase
MKILSASQMRMADSHTIKNEPIRSSDLMERAAGMCFDWLIKNTDNSKKHIVICGTGNNGGDGIVIARKYAERKLPVQILVLNATEEPSPDFKEKFSQIKTSQLQVNMLKEGDLLKLDKNCIIIDAIFGTGLSRPVSGWMAQCVESINNSGNEIVSIDLPSGLFADTHTQGAVIHATHTLTFQCPKLAFMFPENGKFVGDFHLLDIGLDKEFIRDLNSLNRYTGSKQVKELVIPRTRFSHKGNFGHSLLISGSKGKIGAAVLAARACLRSGTGLLTVHLPECGYTILQTAVPEAMVVTDSDKDEITSISNQEQYDAIGVGPGIGKSEKTQQMLLGLLKQSKRPVVLDADALNILAESENALQGLPPNSILTPHLKEFERLAGKSENDFERHLLQIKFSVSHKCIVVLKGAHTCITLPDGKSFFNSTGNPGMALGGSGDVLTGMILAFLSQGYKPEEAAQLGVYLHGLAGDIAAKKKSEYAMTASDIIENIPRAFKKLTD